MFKCHIVPRLIAELPEAFQIDPNKFICPDSPLAIWEVNFGYPNVWTVELDGKNSTGCTPFFLDGKNPWVSGEDFPNQSSDGPKNQNPVMVLKINI